MIQSNTKIEPLIEDLQNLIPASFLVTSAFKRWTITNNIDGLWQQCLILGRKERRFISFSGDDVYDARNAFPLILNYLYASDNFDSFFYFIYNLLELYVAESSQNIDVDDIKKDLVVAGVANEYILQLDSLNSVPCPSKDENIQDSDELREKVLCSETIYNQLSMKEPNSRKTIDAYLDWHGKAVMYLSKYYNETDPDYLELKNLDNSGNGFSLKSNYQSIRSKYSLLMNNTNKNQVIDNKTEKSPLVFISHSSCDKTFVEALVDFLESLGFTPQTLFCSSVTGYGIPLCGDIYETLRNKFANHDLFMIFVLSPNYYRSCASLNEMGAAWVLKSDYCSFLTSNMEFGDMKGVVNQNRISIKVNAVDVQERLNELRSLLVTKFHLNPIDDSIWERKRKKFLDEVNSISYKIHSQSEPKED